ncbi:MAG: hypothetical protein ABWZ98_08735 [Nakamurella sp.]
MSAPMLPADRAAMRKKAAAEKAAGQQQAKAAEQARIKLLADAFKEKHPSVKRVPDSTDLISNEKYSYQVIDQEAKKQIEAAFSSFQQKTKFEKKARVDLALGSQKVVDGKESISGPSAMGDYPRALRLGTVANRMLDSGLFKRFEIRSDPADPTLLHLFDETKGGSAAQVRLGRAAFTPAPAQGMAREIVSKHHQPSPEKSYVLDDANVPTRRYAYFETSRQQLMTALGDQATGKLPPALRGRYIRHREAMGLTTKVEAVSTDMKEISSADPDLAKLYGLPPGVITPEVMANIHQYLGSGTNQRGLSLTSTEKTQIYSNEGKSFKSKDGVRIKVDLSMIPKDVILLNHYAEGGVGSRLEKSGFNPKMLEKGPKAASADDEKGYNYARSVVKNRELLLQELRPEWIVDITDHLQESGSKAAPAVRGPASSVNPQTISQLREALGHAHYEAGRADGSGGKPNVARIEKFANDSYQIGFKAGQEEKAGRDAAKGDIAEFWAIFGANDPTGDIKLSTPPTLAEVATISADRLGAKEWAELLSTKPAWYVLVSLRRVKTFRKDMHDSYWLAWAEAAAVSSKLVTAETAAPEVKVALPAVTTVPSPAAVPKPGAKDDKTD